MICHELHGLADHRSGLKTDGNNVAKATSLRTIGRGFRSPSQNAHEKFYRTEGLALY
jgi:hypothetical protein